MVIPSAIGVSQPGWSRVKPPFCSHQSGWDAIRCNLPERPGERVGGWGGAGGSEERCRVVIYCLYHREFYGPDLWFWGEFYGLTKDGQFQFKTGAVSSHPGVCVCVWVFWPICANFSPLTGIFHHSDSLLFIHSTLFRLIHILHSYLYFLIECFSMGQKKSIHFGRRCFAAPLSLNIRHCSPQVAFGMFHGWIIRLWLFLQPERDIREWQREGYICKRVKALVRLQ